jgi:hypothetical protein
MRKVLLVGLVVGLFLALTALPASAGGGKSGDSNGRPGTDVQVYVTSQGLYYDSIVVTDLPQRGRFQELVPTMTGLQTEFGPGTPGYLGGRWWLDVNGDGMQNEGDMFFLCPLLGPGSPTP